MCGRLITQRRGKGTPRYRSPGHRFTSDAKYPSVVGVFGELASGQIIDIVHDPGKSAPLAKILFENFDERYLIAHEGARVGRWIQMGVNAAASEGNVLPLGKMTEGTLVYNIEIRPGDGGKLVRSAGTSAAVVSHERELGITHIRLPSRKTMTINSNARATIGRVSGSGMQDKPMAHAGPAWYAHKARGKLYPIVNGNAKNACDHPHGGGRNPHGRSPVGRNTPPGRKVGHIAPKRTGRKKRA
jgi:large subunit ribosomal protein L2